MRPLLTAIVAAVATFVGVSALLATPMGIEPASALAYLLGIVAFLWGIGSFRALSNWTNDREEPQILGWRRYFSFAVDHKVIGVQYLVISFVIFLVSGLMALIMRAELTSPGLQFLSYQSYNTVMGFHGIGMVVVALIAILGGLGNFMVPLMIGARDMAFPRMNAVSFWLLPPAVLILLATFVTGGFDFGWTAYPPLSVKGPVGKLYFVFAFITVGVSSILGGVNFLTTVVRMRAPGLTWGRLPIFVWGTVAASIIALMGTSVVASSLFMVLLDRVMGTSFFDPSKGGNALLYQHLFWFYSHPAVYIMSLPAFGTVLEILPVFSRKPLFAYRIAAGSFIAIVILSFLVWAHHLFTSGMWDLLSIPFMVTTELISVPTGAIFLSAFGTLWLGSLRIRPPMLWAMGMLANFLIGGLTGIFLADVPTDLHLHDTWFVMAHFHFTIVGGGIFAFFAGLYHWFPKITGRLYHEGLAKAHFWLMFIGFHLTFIPMFWMGTHGMRRRVADFPPEFSDLQLWISTVSYLMVIGMVVFLYNMIRSARKGPLAGANPWDARTLEWQVASPPPHENFAAIPHVTSSPYDYGRAE